MGGRARAGGTGARRSSAPRREFLARGDVHRAPGPSERRFTTSDLLAHEQAIVHGAQARRGEGTGRLDRALVDAVLASAPLRADGRAGAG